MRYITTVLVIAIASSSVAKAQTNEGFDFPAYAQQAAYQRQVQPDIIDQSHLRQNDASINVESSSSFPTLAPRTGDKPTAEPSKSKSLGPLVTTASSLAVVLGLFAGLVWLTRRFGNGSMTQGSVPSDVLKSLGSTAIDARTRITMLRCGNRIILMAQTVSGVHPLSEITDPDEVQRLTAACIGGEQPSFAETLKQVDAETPRRQLFASA